MDLMVGATYENIMMVEGEMDEVSEQDLLAALKAAHEAIKPQCKAQMELAELVGSTVKREYCHEVNDEELRQGCSRCLLCQSIRYCQRKGNREQACPPGCIRCYL